MEPGWMCLMQARCGWSRWLLLAILFSSSGATCVRRSSPLPEFQPPVAFQNPPDLMQVVEVVNRSQAIEQLQSNSVSIRMSGVPGAIQSTLAWQRPKFFRLIGGGIAGKYFDIGSNHEVFWLEAREGLQPKLYYAQHEQYEAQMHRLVLPVSPLWLVEAMGIVAIDPYLVTEPPLLRADGNLEVRSSVPTAIGAYYRTLVIDPKFGYPRQVLLRDPQGRLLANALMSKHQYYASVQYSLPHQVQVQLIPEGSPPLDMQLEVGNYGVNQIEGNDPNRWTMPSSRDNTPIDLVQLSQGATQSVQPPPTAPAYPYRDPRTSYRGWDQHSWPGLAR
jgi:hypothetical protein